MDAGAAVLTTHVLGLSLVAFPIVCCGRRCRGRVVYGYLRVCQRKAWRLFLTCDWAADCRYKIRKRLQKSIQSVTHMQDQVQHAMNWLCQAYGISMDDAMR